MEIRATSADTITKPVDAVFQAVVDPARLCKYFASAATGPLAPGASVTWTFADVNGEVDVRVKEYEENRRIVFVWSATGPETTVEMAFEAKGPGMTDFRVVETGWTMDREGVDLALRQTAGWTDFFCCLKAFLLFDVDLRRGKRL